MFNNSIYTFTHLYLFTIKGYNMTRQENFVLKFRAGPLDK